MKHKVASNLLWMLAERGLQVVVGIGVVAMLARALGPEGFAQFQYAQAVVYVAASVALICGAEVVVPRLVANVDPIAQHRLLAHAFALRLAGGVLGYGLMCAFLLMTRQPIDFWLPSAILGIAIVLREPFGIVTAWMQSHTQTRPNTLFSIASMAIKASGIALLFALGTRSVPAYAAIYSIEPIVMAGLLATLYLARAPRERAPLTLPLMHELFTSGLLFWVSFMLMIGARRVDQLLLKPYVPLSDLGAYAASMQILDNFVVIASIVSAGIAPVYIYAQPTLTRVCRNVIRIAGGMTVIGAAGAITIALSAHWIIQILYGAAFAHAVHLLQLAALASILVFADVALTLLPVYLRRPDIVALKWGGALLITVAIDWIAIPKLGAIGAIVGSATANLMSILFGIAILIRFRKTPSSMKEVRA